jgi:hypothetical protein
VCLLVIWVFGNEGEPRNHKGGTGDDRRSFDVVVVTSPTDKTLDVLYAASNYSSVRWYTDEKVFFCLSTKPGNMEERKE